MKLAVVLIGFVSVVFGLPSGSSISSNAIAADNRILGGSDAAPGQFPFIVSIRADYTKNHYCSGNIVTKRHVLTAAHCNEYYDVIIRVIAGKIEYNGMGDEYIVQKWVNHEKYLIGPWMINDISMITLDRDIVFGELVQPVKLPTVDVGGGFEGVAIGWGFTNVEGTEHPKTLQWVRTVTLSYEECYNSVPNVALPTHLCTLNEPGEGICQGDSGGPFLDNSNVIYGIGSLSYCGEGKPDFFTRVYDYVDWIHEHTDGLLDN